MAVISTLCAALLFGVCFLIPAILAFVMWLIRKLIPSRKAVEDPKPGFPEIEGSEVVDTDYREL